MTQIIVEGEKFKVDGQMVTHAESGAWFQMSAGDNAHVHSRNTKNLDKPAETEAQALTAWKLYRTRSKESG